MITAKCDVCGVGPAYWIRHPRQWWDHWPYVRLYLNRWTGWFKVSR